MRISPSISQIPCRSFLSTCTEYRREVKNKTDLKSNVCQIGRNFGETEGRVEISRARGCRWLRPAPRAWMLPRIVHVEHADLGQLLLLAQHGTPSRIHHAQVRGSMASLIGDVPDEFARRGFLCGSESYTPSTVVPLNTASAFSSAARSAAAVSVVKKGLPRAAGQQHDLAVLHALDGARRRGRCSAKRVIS